MQAIVLAAGKGTRMLPLTLDVPKPLIRVLGKPLIEYMIDALPPTIDEVIIVVGYKEEMIKNHLGKKYKNFSIRYIQQKKLEGPAAAMNLCRKYITGDFLVRNSDDILDHESIAQACERTPAALAFEHNEPEHFGVMIPDKNDMLVEIKEKPASPKSNLVWPGIFTFTKDIFDYYPPPPHKNGEYYIPDMVPAYIKKHPVRIIRAKFWIPVTTPQDIPLAEEYLKD